MPGHQVENHVADKGAGTAVQIARGFVRQQDARAHHHGPGDSDTLAFAAGQLVRKVIHTFAKTDLIQSFPRLAFGFGILEQIQRQADVFQGGEVRHQVELLEDDADVLGTEFRQRFLVQVMHVLAVENDGSRRG